MILPAVHVTNHAVRDRAVSRCRERAIILPTFAQMRHPETIPPVILDRLASIGLWDIHPLNLFRITWKNEPVEQGGSFSSPNFIELPSRLTGIPARVIMLIGKWFPTGAHKVGAAYGCLVPRLVTGQFDPEYNIAVWPSTGNYCRGGAFDSALLDCASMAILPEGMSSERFDWLRQIGAEIIPTPGSESNVKEIYDACDEIRRTRPECVIFNQFDEFGNACWHYHVTGPAIADVWDSIKQPRNSCAAFVSATGSAGTIAAGDFLRTRFPHIRVVAAEALQCPTLLMNGFGAHRIEGIGDKHVPWIHNVKNTDAVAAVDDALVMRLLRLFNEPSGHAWLRDEGFDDALLEKLPLLGISSIANLCAVVKAARYFEWSAADVIFTVATDSAALYQSRLAEMNQQCGDYSALQAGLDFEAFRSLSPAWFKELSYQDRHAIHNLKYYTWVEQQHKSVDDLNQLWYDPDIWQTMFDQPARWDELITEFNQLAAVPQ